MLMDRSHDETEHLRMKIEEEWEANKHELHAGWRELSLRIQSLRESVLDAGDLASDDLDNLKKYHICIMTGTWLLKDEATGVDICEGALREQVYTRYVVCCLNRLCL